MPCRTLLALCLLLPMLFVCSTAGADDPAWSEQEWSLIQSLSIDKLPQQPGDVSNRVLNNPQAVELGAKLFFDPRLSRNGTVSCAGCHQPDKYFSDGLNVALGDGIGRRNTPSLHGVAYNDWFFWDGRKDSLWSQALGPLEDPQEQNLSRTDIVRLVLTDNAYQTAYQGLFGRSELNPANLPVDARPSGTIGQIRLWKEQPLEQRQSVDNTFANIGKAIAAYVATIKPLPSRFDRYVAAMTEHKDATGLLKPDELRGLRLFIGSRAQCINCHSGPLLSNRMFQNIGTGEPGRDSGRAAAVDQVRLDRFNCLGEYSDAPAEACTELKYMQRNRHALAGAYKTPSLRNVGNTAPYFHDGRMSSLAEVIAYYANGGAALARTTDLPKIELNAQEQQYLLAFLLALNADTP